MIIRGARLEALYCLICGNPSAGFSSLRSANYSWSPTDKGRPRGPEVAGLGL